MPVKTFVFDQIQKLMGWCPACRKMTLQTEQPCNFINTAQISGKTGNIPEFRTSNIIFPANTTLVFVLFYICISLLLRYPEDISLFLAGLFLLNIFYYFLYLKTLEAAVLVDRFGVHMHAFRLKKFEIPFEEIESMKLCRLEKRSKKMSLLLVIGGIALCGFFVYIAVAEGEWKPLLLLVSIIPLLLLVEMKQKMRFWNLNTQLYIKTRHKKLYEWTPYYSLITDEASAAELKSFIERHL
ncbi:DUF1673 family protein [Methanosarcina mazei]|jgi:hypothetical protein|uniref:DUF1673 domain-containing protein n=1 Tax=Methanosarcina mazei TaxID=2209 RepID=A0A0F8DLF5_METMZ|nr:DUF1673 family protein [Methanosarcina mazei]KKG29132.1 hypothetical protein DU52_01730 [Methanosarcina mazei]QCR17053.1 DUF1673 domain-containing protein [Methanosarcina mazei]